MWKINRFYRLLLTIAFLTPFAPHAFADEWRGSYSDPDSGQSVSFTLELSGSQGPVHGRTSEPNTFGNRSASQLFANVSGAINGSSISFTKTYDGTGGVSHSVVYRGTIVGNIMSGTWTVGGRSGGFSASRVAQASSCDRCERFRGQGNACNSCCQCQQNNNTKACSNQNQGNPDGFNACLNRASQSRESCNRGCFGP